MKKILKIALTSFAVLSLISCVDNQTSNNESSVSGDSSSSESSSSVPQDVYYHVVFINDDENKTVLYEVDVPKGNEAVYSGETPTKAEDDEFAYEFQGWDKELTNIQADVTTFAVYKATAKENWGPIIWY